MIKSSLAAVQLVTKRPFSLKEYKTFKGHEIKINLGVYLYTLNPFSRMSIAERVRPFYETNNLAKVFITHTTPTP